MIASGKTFKRKIYNLVEKGSHGRKFNRVFDYAIMSLIILSVISIVLQSIKEIDSKFDPLLIWFDNFSVIVFSAEYLLRLYISDLTHPSGSRVKSVFKFIFSAYGLIDLLAIIPFYLPMLITMDLRFLRTMRLTRFLWILKINRYNDSLKLIGIVIREKRSELTVTGFVAFIILLIASFIMYYLEGDIQPDVFPNILATFWWSVETLTTVGYGDVYPVTIMGKLLSGLIAIVGIGLVALPTGLISAGFMHKIESRKSGKVCPHCGKKIDEHGKEVSG